jgi:hypothetical protein
VSRKPQLTLHEKDRDFLRLLREADLAAIESWVADMNDPFGGLQDGDSDWKCVAIERAYKRITGRELGVP